MLLIVEKEIGQILPMGGQILPMGSKSTG